MMKRYIKTLFIILVIVTTATSCDDFLEIEPKDSVVSETLLQTEAGMGLLLNGIYPVYSDSWSYRLGHWYLGATGTDLAYDRATNWRSNFQTFSLTPADPNFIPTFFRNHFRAIGAANNAINEIENSPLSEDIKNEGIAEARCLRAWSYSELTRYYGEVPILLEAVPTVGVANALTPAQGARQAVAEVFAQVIEPDLTFAVENLPATSRLPGTPTSWAAKAILARAYVQFAGQYGLDYWDDAIPVLEDIINNGPFTLDVASYADIFTLANEANGSQRIWVNKWTSENRGGSLPRWVLPAETTPELIAEDPSRRVYTGEWPGSGALNFVRVYKEFYDTFDPTDLRRDVAIRNLTSNYTANDGSTVYSGNRWAYAINKYREITTSGNRDAHDNLFMRIADVYLLLAEAENEVNGPTAKAQQAINAVRSRAGLSNLDLGETITGHFAYGNNPEPNSTQEGFRYAVLRERAWELCFEMHRRSDLVRHGLLDDMALNRWESPTNGGESLSAPARITSWVEGHELFPIPLEQITLNGWEQNPGY